MTTGTTNKNTIIEKLTNIHDQLVVGSHTTAFILEAGYSEAALNGLMNLLLAEQDKINALLVEIEGAKAA